MRKVRARAVEEEEEEEEVEDEACCEEGGSVGIEDSNDTAAGSDETRYESTASELAWRVADEVVRRKTYELDSTAGDTHMPSSFSRCSPTVLLTTTLILPLSGLNFFGMLSQVFLPMMTAFLAASEVGLEGT